MKFFYLAILALLLLSSCETNEEVDQVEEESEVVEAIAESNEYLLNQGLWIGYLRINDIDKIPFNLEVIHDSIYFVNADEKLGSAIHKDGEQYVIEMPIFDSEFRFSVTEKGLFGFWHNYAKSETYQIPFVAKKSRSRELL